MCLAWSSDATQRPIEFACAARPSEGRQPECDPSHQPCVTAGLWLGVRENYRRSVLIERDVKVNGRLIFGAKRLVLLICLFDRPPIILQISNYGE